MACCCVKKKRKIDLDLAAGRGPAGDEPAVLAEAAHGVLPDGGADVLEDDVRALAAGLRLHFLGDVLRVVVDEDIGAELLGLFQFVLGAGDGEHAGGSRLGDLDRRPCRRRWRRRKRRPGRWPGCVPCVCSMFQAVTNVSGTAAHSTNDHASLIGKHVPVLGLGVFGEAALRLVALDVKIVGAASRCRGCTSRCRANTGRARS